MTDLYDSLEDDDEDKSSTFFLDRRKTGSPGSVRRAWESNATEKYSFFLNKCVNERPNLCPVFQPFSNKYSERKFILPKIKSDCKEGEFEVPEALPNIVVDNESLLEQGLQCNQDGSFTRSPRAEKEELPFITREYRNLQFQKRKTYALNKNKTVKCHKKNLHSFANVSGSQISANMNTRKKKGGSNEEVLKSDSSLSSKSKLGKKSSSVSHSKNSHNLTDSMKEKLMQSFSGGNESPGKEAPKKEVSGSISPVASKSSQQNKTLPAGRRKSNVEKSWNSSPKEKPQLLNDKEKTRSVSQTIPKYKSDILLNAPKPKLNYWERHQMESGYNPFFLRQGSKKVPDDTNRSNFGDSVMEDLSEVSYRVLSCDNLGREEEEMFYRELIQKDKTKKQAQRSSRSEGPLEFAQKGQILFKSQKELLSGRSNSKSKHKSMFIDMPSEGNQSVNSSKKCSHFCTTNSSSNLSKVELALKARTYGYLVNARNIFKLKAQSEGKFASTGRESNEKILNKMSELSTNSAEPPFVNGKLMKQNSLPVNIFPTVKTEIIRKLENLPRVSASWSKEKHLEKFRGSQRGFLLPQVNGEQPKGGQMNAKLFEEINSCLVSPNI